MFLIVFLLGTLIVGAFVMLITMLKNRTKERDFYQDEMIRAQNQVSKLTLELKIKSENRTEADEKINALHNGNSVSNAIAGLSKH